MFFLTMDFQSLFFYLSFIKLLFIGFMLKFLDESHNVKQPKNPLKFLPAMVYGHTHDSVPHMLNKHSVYYQPTDKKSSKAYTPGIVKLPPCVKQEFKISNNGRSSQSKRLQKRSQSQPHIPYQITQGEFSNFLDRHKNYNEIGVLYKQNTSESKLQNPKESIFKSKWNKSTNPKNSTLALQTSQNKTSMANIIKDTSMTSMRMGSLPISRSSSVSFIQKPINLFHLKQRRQEFANIQKMEHDVKRKTLCSNFALPNRGAAHELFFLWKDKKKEKFNIDERKEMNNEIDKFEKQMKSHFK